MLLFVLFLILFFFLMKPAQVHGSSSEVWNQMDQKTLSCVTHLMHNMLPVRALEWVDF